MGRNYCKRCGGFIGEVPSLDGVCFTCINNTHNIKERNEASKWFIKGFKKAIKTGKKTANHIKASFKEEWEKNASK